VAGWDEYCWTLTADTDEGVCDGEGIEFLCRDDDVDIGCV
jgi:hypothetical protein